MNELKPFILSYYDKEVVNEIITKYGMTPFDALSRFLSSETYQMLIDDKLEMWDFSPLGIFDMWENEQVTGTPQTSLYLRRD